MDKFKELLLKLSWTHVIAISALYGAFTFYTQDHSQVDEKEERIRLVKTEIETVNRKLNEAKEFEKQIEQKKAALADLEAQLRSKKAELPKSFNVPELLADIFHEAQQVGLEVADVVPDQNEQKAELHASMKIEIKARGTFLQLFIFLDRLSKLKRLVGVTNVSLQAGSQTDRVTLKGTTVALSGKKLTGGDKTYRQVQGVITLLAYRII